MEAWADEGVEMLSALISQIISIPCDDVSSLI
jgi:hypothetical protein